MAMDETNAWMMECFNDAGVPCYWSGLCLWFGLPESDRSFAPAGARWSRKRGMWYRKFDYQSECHCSKTTRARPRSEGTFDYQSECHCSKTSQRL